MCFEEKYIYILELQRTLWFACKISDFLWSSKTINQTFQKWFPKKHKDKAMS